MIKQLKAIIKSNLIFSPLLIAMFPLLYFRTKTSSNLATSPKVQTPTSEEQQVNKSRELSAQSTHNSTGDHLEVQPVNLPKEDNEIVTEKTMIVITNMSLSEGQSQSSEIVSNIENPKVAKIETSSPIENKTSLLEVAQTSVILEEIPLVKDGSLTDASVMVGSQNNTEYFLEQTSKRSEKISEKKTSENVVSATEVTSVNHTVTMLPSADMVSSSADLPDSSNRKMPTSSEKSTNPSIVLQGKVQLTLFLSTHLSILHCC
jgi:hypothetical protein